MGNARRPPVCSTAVAVNPLDCVARVDPRGREHSKPDAGPRRSSSSRPVSLETEPAVSIQDFAFGSIRIDDKTYEHDVVIDRGTVCKRHKTPSKALRDTTGHTPLSASENIPWRCRRLVVGTGAFGRLPILPDVRREAKRRCVELVELPTAEAVELLRNDPPDTNAILHVTC